MPSAAATLSSPCFLVSGEDEFAVKQRARHIFQQWCALDGGVDQEIIDASAANSGEALSALARLREALQTFPFFGSAKVIWFQDCNFLGDERAAGAAAVTEALSGLAQELKVFSWDKVRLLVSAGKVDKRKVFYKAIEKIGAVESLAGWSLEDKDWAGAAELWARQALRERRQEISDEALAELVNNVGPHARQLHNEIEKLTLYAGDRKVIELADVQAVCTRNRHARAFALGDALGDRDLPRLLGALEDELWELQFDKRRSEIGLLYGLITKVRALIFLQEMLREGWVKPVVEFNHFKAQLQRVPTDRLPEDKRFNPLAMNPYVLFKALPQARRYTPAELVSAMELLLRCNQRLVSTSLDDALVLQQTLVQIVSDPAGAETGVAR